MEDYTSPRVTALSLVAQLCRKRKAASLPPCLEFCRDRFAAFEAGSESPSALDGALFLFGSLGAHFADAKAPPRPRASPALAPRLGAPRPFMALFVSVHGAGASVLGAGVGGHVPLARRGNARAARRAAAPRPAGTPPRARVLGPRQLCGLHRAGGLTFAPRPCSAGHITSAR